MVSVLFIIAVLLIILLRKIYSAKSELIYIVFFTLSLNFYIRIAEVRIMKHLNLHWSMDIIPYFPIVPALFSDTYCSQNYANIIFIPNYMTVARKKMQGQEIIFGLYIIIAIYASACSYDIVFIFTEHRDRVEQPTPQGGSE